MPCPGDYSRKTICGGPIANTIISTGLAEDHPRCRDGWVPYGEHCYYFNNTRVTWNAAKSICAQMGPSSELATVNYPVINDLIQSKAAEFQMDMWIGLHCQRQNNYFEWVSGDPVLFTNWYTREPNNWASYEDCVEIYGHNGKWNDDSCNDLGSTNGYVCRSLKEELPNAPTPSPDPNCPQGWTAYRWKCFSAVMVLRWTWNQAKSQCEQLGGSLVRIEDQSEQAFLTASFGLTAGNYWTDLNEADGQFRFTNSLAPTFTNWGQNQPASLGGSSCVVINMTAHGQWHNIDCQVTEQTYSICEVDEWARQDPQPHPRTRHKAAVPRGGSRPSTTRTASISTR